MTKINLKKITFSPWIMWGIAATFYAYRYLIEVSPAVIVNDLMRSLSINAADLGNLAAFFLYAYCGMQPVVGILLDRFGAKRLLTSAAFISALGILIFGFASSLPLAASGRLLSGLGSSFAAVGCMYIASQWLPPNRFALATGLVLTVGMLGATGGSAPLAFLVTILNWRHVLALLSIAGTLIAVFIWIIVRDKKPSLIENIQKKATKKSVLAGLKLVMRNKQSWLLAIYAGLLFMPISIFGSLWGVQFLINKCSITNTQAATLIITLYMGLAVGAPFFGWLSDYINKRNIVMYIAGLGTTLSVATMFYVPHLSQLIISVLLFAFGFFTGGSFVAYASILENNPQEYSGSVLGFMNTMNMVGGALGMPLVGLFLDWQWSGAMVNGIRTYSLANYQVALSILPIAMLISVVFLFWIKETNCKRID